MNFIKKDKYRTKLIEHLLHQCSDNEQQNVYSNTNIYPNSVNQNTIEGSYKIHANKMFQKVSKNKALICDSQQTERNKQNYFNNKQNCSHAYDTIDNIKNKKSFNTINTSSNNHKSKQTKLISSSKKCKNNYQFITNDLPEPRSHLSKQKYVYHQKLPIISVSEEVNSNILLKLKKKDKQLTINNQNKQNDKNFVNNNDNFNNVQQKQRQKKYKFVTATKIAEVKQRKRKANQQRQNIQIKQNKQKVDEVNSEVYFQQKSSIQTAPLLNSTTRSKGSKQMMQFLQSAREKLFINMNSLNENPHNQVSKQKNNNSTKKSTNYQVQKSKEQSVGLNHTFKIQIQISKDKTCDIQLNFSSDPHKIAKNFIMSNRSLLSSFKGLQQGKLEQLLSDRIQHQIQRQKRLFQQKKDLQIQQNYRKIIDHIGVNKMLLNDQQQELQQQQEEYRNVLKQQTKVKNKSTILKRNENLKSKLKKKSTKKQQYEHVYIENIDSLPNQNKDFNDQSPILQKNHRRQLIKQQTEMDLVNQYNDEDKCNSQTKNNIPQLKKLVSFNFKEHGRQFFQHNEQDCSKWQINMKGYLNSPHELITYRENSEGSHSDINRESKLQEFKEESRQKTEEQIVNHFPLSKSTAEFKSLSKNVNNSFKKRRNQQNLEEGINMDFCDQEIGALKILSKSRQKLKRSTIQNYPSRHQQKLQQIQIQQAKDPKEQNLPVSIQSQRQLQKSIPSSPKMVNSMSQLIINRLGGKQNVLSQLRQKQIQKREQIIKQKQQKQQQKMKQCSFRPKINNLSKVIDENKKKRMKIVDLIQSQMKNTLTIDGQNNLSIQKNKSTINNSKKIYQSRQYIESLQNQKPIVSKSIQKTRYIDLYDNFKTIQAKKQFIRQKSIQQISFKPQINLISKRIIQSKRNSLNNSICQQFYHTGSASLSKNHSTCKKPNQRRNSAANNTYCQNNNQNDERYNMSNHKKRKSMNFSRNLQGLEIGQYLYKQAMRLKKKKQLMSQTKIQNFKPLNKSQQIMNKIKQKRLRQYFYELLGVQNDEIQQANEYQLALSAQNLDLNQEKFNQQPLKYLVPLLKQLKQLEVSLTVDQFIDSGLKLINYLSIDEKSQFLSKKKDNLQQLQQKLPNQPILNQLSKKLIQKKQYYLQDIYHRGLVYKKQIKDKIQHDMENKVRKQLEKCTFKPFINKGYQTIE